MGRGAEIMIVSPLFSESDSDLMKLVWYISGNDRYPKRTISKKYKNRAHLAVLERMLGRKILKGEICDHINGDVMDCRRENLRLTNLEGNAQHRPKNKPFRGTTFHKATGKWQAQVQSKKIPPRERYLGLFVSREEAATIAEKKRVELGFLGAQTDNEHDETEDRWSLRDAGRDYYGQGENISERHT
jgi:hypothetical protein